MRLLLATNMSLLRSRNISSPQENRLSCPSRKESWRRSEQGDLNEVLNEPRRVTFLWFINRHAFEYSICIFLYSVTSPNDFYLKLNSLLIERRDFMHFHFSFIAHNAAGILLQDNLVRNDLWILSFGCNKIFKWIIALARIIATRFHVESNESLIESLIKIRSILAFREKTPGSLCQTRSVSSHGLSRIHFNDKFHLLCLQQRWNFWTQVCKVFHFWQI